MSEEIGAARDGDDDAGRRNDDISAADERALTALFASLVADAEPSELSPLEVRRLAVSGASRRSDSRSKRIKTARNILVAAVVAAAVLLTLPRLIRSSSSDTAANAMSSTAAAPAGSAGDAGAAAAGTSSAAAASGSPYRAPGVGSAGVSAPAASAPGKRARALTTEAAASAASSPSALPSAPASGSASSGAAPDSGSSSSAASSAAASSSAASAPGCPPLPKAVVAAVTKALPAAYRGAAVTVQGCSVTILASPGHPRIALLVTRSAPGVCAAQGSCTGTTDSDTYVGRPKTEVYVYGKGVAVTIPPAPGQPNRVALVALARALVGALPTA